MLSLRLIVPLPSPLLLRLNPVDFGALWSMLLASCCSQSLCECASLLHLQAVLERKSMRLNCNLLTATHETRKLLLGSRLKYLRTWQCFHTNTDTGPAGKQQLHHLDVKHQYDVTSPVTVGLRDKVHSLLRYFMKKIFVAIMKG